MRTVRPLHWPGRRRRRGLPVRRCRRWPPPYP
uniref:Uncharacterized protein n=1 Tax=Arundo donax TaxID=35708 RepID=A0A0A8YDG6_ARUDO